MYSVYIPSKPKQPLKKTNCLRSAAIFAENGRARRIFDSTTGKEITQGGTIGITYDEFLRINS